MIIELPGKWSVMDHADPQGLWYVWHQHGPGNHHWTSACMVYQHGRECNLCSVLIPDEIGGFIELLKWER